VYASTGINSDGPLCFQTVHFYFKTNASSYLHIIHIDPKFIIWYKSERISSEFVFNAHETSKIISVQHVSVFTSVFVSVDKGKLFHLSNNVVTRG